MSPDVWEGPLYVAQHGFSRGILSNDTARFPHGMVDGVPFSPTMMFPRGYDRFALQRNKFVKPSRADGAAGVCRERPRAAAAPWKAAREPGMEEGRFPEPSKRCRDIVDRRPVDDP